MSELPGSRRVAALLEAMLASSLDAVVTIDASGRVLTFNRAAEMTLRVLGGGRPGP